MKNNNNNKNRKQTSKKELKLSPGSDPYLQVTSCFILHTPQSIKWAVESPLGKVPGSSVFEEAIGESLSEPWPPRPLPVRSMDPEDVRSPLPTGTHMTFLPKRLPDRLPGDQVGTDVCGAGRLERFSDGWPGSHFPGHMCGEELFECLKTHASF